MIIAIQSHGRLLHLAEGIRAVGLDQVVEPGSARADLNVFWGYRAALDARLPKPILICDKGFLRRPSIMLGMGGEWGNLATWPTVPHRKADIAEWQYTASKVALILGQDPDDFSTKQAVQNYNKWKFNITDELATQEWQVRYREHPRVLLHAPIEIPRPPALADDLRDVGLCVGLNTGALVECAIAGYPIHAVDSHSLVYPLSVGWTDERGPEPEGRQALFDGMAGQCWTYSECASGMAWEAVRDEVLSITEYQNTIYS